MTYRPNNKASGAGFSLVELAVVLTIVSLLFVFVLPTSTAILNGKKSEQTQQKLRNIATALTNYVAIQKRLPCPAAGALNSGTEMGGPPYCNNQIGGVVPWFALGLTESDIEDGWDHRITYRVAYGLSNINSLDMTWCDPAGVAAASGVGIDTSCVTACTGTSCTSPQNFLTGNSVSPKGFYIYDGSGNKIMNPTTITGAAYVLISHGENGYGAFSSTGTVITQPTNGHGGGPLEVNNANSTSPAVTLVAQPTFTDTDISTASTATYFDDILVHPSVFSLIQSAQVGPRSH